MKKKRLIGIIFLMICLLIAVSSVYSYIKPPCYDCGSVGNCDNGNGFPDSGYDSCTVVYWTNGQPSRCILGSWGC